MKPGNLEKITAGNYKTATYTVQIHHHLNSAGYLCDNSIIFSNSLECSATANNANKPAWTRVKTTRNYLSNNKYLTNFQLLLTKISPFLNFRSPLLHPGEKNVKG